MESYKKLTLSECWKNFTVADRIANIKQSVDELQFKTLKGFQKNLQTEVVSKVETLPSLNQNCGKIAEIGRQLPGEGFCALHAEQIENELMTLVEVDLDDEEVLKLTETKDDSENDETNEKSEAILSKQLSLNLLDKVFERDEEIMEIISRREK